MQYDVIDARISPNGNLDVLSRLEVGKLLNTSQGELYPLFRNSSLAVLNYGGHLDDGRELLERYKDFDIRVIQEERGIKLDLRSAPASAFVDGKMIRESTNICSLCSATLSTSTTPSITTPVSTCRHQTASPTLFFTSCATQGSCGRAPIPAWWSAGAGIR